MTVSEALDNSINIAITSGSLDPDLMGATIEAARKVAKVMDEEDWPIVRGKIDNVSPSVFLKYCEALGLSVPKKAEKVVSEKVVNLAASKWKRA